MKKKIYSKAAAGLLAAILLLAGAGTAAADTGPGAASADSTGQADAATGTAYCRETTVGIPASIPYGDLGSQRAVRQNNTMSDIFRSGLYTFSCKTAAALMKDSQGNINYSPVSLYYSLALAAHGANGSTKNQLYTLLAAPGQDLAKMPEECGSLYRLMYRADEVCRIKPSASLWLKDGSAISDAYRRTAEQQYYSDIFRLDLSDSGAADIMGQWISERAPQTVSPTFTTAPEEAMRIISTMDLSNQWTFDFDRAGGTEGSFFLADGQQAVCGFMTDTRKCTYYRGKGFVRASLSQKDNSTVTFILPDRGISPQSLLSSDEAVHEMFGTVTESYGPVAWKIPRFSISSSLELRPMLEGMGVTDAFSPGKADFSGITDARPYVDHVLQVTRMDVNENGTGASGYLDVPMLEGIPSDEIPVDMTLDRPFLYSVSGAPGVLLYMGMCMNPAA